MRNELVMKAVVDNNGGIHGEGEREIDRERTRDEPDPQRSYILSDHVDWENPQSDRRWSRSFTNPYPEQLIRPQLTNTPLEKTEGGHFTVT